MKSDSPAVARFPFGIFFWVFVFTFTLVFGISVITTALEPKSYTSAARIEVKYKPSESKGNRVEKTFNQVLAKTESEVINSEVILKKVVVDLNLNTAWGKKYFNGDTLKTWETLEILKGRTSISPVSGTTLIQIRAFDDNPNDAAMIANGIAGAYTGYVATNGGDLQAEIIDSAHVAKVPVRPHKALNYFWGIVAGMFFGLLAATGIAFVFYLKNRKAAKALSVNPLQTDIPDPSP